MFYRPSSGGMWDPTLLYWKDAYYLLSMYRNLEEDRWDGMWCARSLDGIHWDEWGKVLPGDVEVCKMFLFAKGDRCILNHGSMSLRPGSHNDTLRFYDTQDMRHWRHLYDTTPDPRWYCPEGRWDHMYVIPKEEKDLEKGFWGYVVATPHHRYQSPFGMMESPDGYQWNPLPPPEILWGDLPPVRIFEVGGCERIGDRYYFIGGVGGYAGNSGYSLYTFVADCPTGPFYPDKEAFRLCGFDQLPGRVFLQNLAAFARGKEGELLITNAFFEEFPDAIWLLPHRKAVVDEQGHLRLGWWPGNKAAQGQEIVLSEECAQPVCLETRTDMISPPALNCPAKGRVTLCSGWLPGDFQLEDMSAFICLKTPYPVEEGAVLEGQFTAGPHPVDRADTPWPVCWRKSAVGFCALEQENSATAMMLEVGHPYQRRSLVERVKISRQGFQYQQLDATGEGCATVRGVSPGERHSFRLYLRRRMMELYIDDLLVQSFLLQGEPSGQIGLLARNAEWRIEDLRLYRLAL